MTNRVGINTAQGFAVMTKHGVRLESIPGVAALDEDQFDAWVSKIMQAPDALAVEALCLPYRGGWA